MRQVKFNHYELECKSSDPMDPTPFTKIVDILRFIEGKSVVDRRYRKNKGGKVLFLESFFETENPGYYYGCFCSVGHRYKQPLLRLDDLAPTNEMEDLQVVKNDGVRTRVYFAIYCDPTQHVMLMLQNVGTTFGVSDFHDYVLHFYGRMRDGSYGDFLLKRCFDGGFLEKIKYMKRVSKIELVCSKNILGPLFSSIGHSPDNFGDDVKVVITPKKDEYLSDVCHDILYTYDGETRKYPHVTRIKIHGVNEMGHDVVMDTENPYSVTLSDQSVNGASGELFKEHVYEFFDEIFS